MLRVDFHVPESEQEPEWRSEVHRPQPTPAGVMGAGVEEPIAARIRGNKLVSTAAFVPGLSSRQALRPRSEIPA
jgi:hypothetical protein